MAGGRFELSPREPSGTRRVRFVPADRKGVLDAEALASLAAAAEALAGDGETTLAVLEGARPDLFAAGADLETVEALSGAPALDFADRGREALAAWESVPATTVAVVRGGCHGGALDLVLSTDLVLAFPAAAFAHPGAKRGIVTGWAGTVRAARRLAPRALLELFASGDPVPADRALANGIVDAVVSTDEELEELLRSFAGPAGDTVRRLKRTARAVEGLPLRAALSVEEALAALGSAEASRRSSPGRP